MVIPKGIRWPPNRTSAIAYFTDRHSSLRSNKTLAVFIVCGSIFEWPSANIVCRAEIYQQSQDSCVYSIVSLLSCVVALLLSRPPKVRLVCWTGIICVVRILHKWVFLVCPYYSPHVRRFNVVCGCLSCRRFINNQQVVCAHSKGSQTNAIQHSSDISKTTLSSLSKE